MVVKVSIAVLLFLEINLFNRNDDCGFEDDQYDATVKYYNPKTYYTAKYDLKVDVEDCEVKVIHFPKGGWLDNTHIKPVEIDEDGNATAIDDKGREWDIHISKSDK